MSDSQGMNITQQIEMWSIFTRIMRAAVIGTVVVLMLMAFFLT